MRAIRSNREGLNRVLNGGKTVKKYYRFFVIFFVFSCWIPHIASAQVVLIYTGSVWWISRQGAIAEAKTTESLLQSAGIQTKITENENYVKQWMLQTTSDGSVDVLILYGVIPTTIYPSGNAMPDGSVAEKWIETRDGNTILNHADYFGFGSTGNISNERGTLQNLMDIPDIEYYFGSVPMFVTTDGSALTPSLVNFQSDRVFRLDQLQGDWFAEKILANNTGDARGTLADPVVVRDGNRGRIAIVHQTAYEDNPKGEVAAEIIANYLLADATAPSPDLASKGVIPDAGLAAAVRKALDLAPNAPITKQAMQRLTTLDAADRQITNLAGLEHATQLEELSLWDNQIRDVSSLAALTNLTGLYLYDNQIRNVNPLTGLTQLKRLRLDGNQIRNIRPLTGLTQLELLHIGRNQIKNYGVQLLTSLTQLKWLSLHGNQIGNIKPLANLAKLEGLWLSHNKIRDVSPLAGLVNLNTLHLNGNPIQDFSPLASLTNLSDVDFSSPEAGIGFTSAGPKIEGPWLWMIVSTGRKPGAAAAALGKDWLAAATGGSVTEAQIATNGAAVGDQVKNRVWTLGRLAPTGEDNIMEVVRATGLAKSTDIDNHVAYGSIALDSPRKQNTTMYAGSDDAVKVWLNGKLVHEYLDDRSASDYQDSFSVTLKKGKNILLVAVYEAAGTWSGFFGFENDAVYSILTTPVVQIRAAQRPPMYWINAQAGTLHRLVGAEVENLVPSVQNATSLVLNSADNKIYWTEQVGKNRGKIKRSNLDGSSVKVLANILNGVPRSIAVDPTQGKLYWTNSNGRIQRANLNGKQVKNLIQNLEFPDKIIVDAAGGKLYWTETPGRIRRANLNGKRIEKIASGLSPVADIAISGNKIYWAEITSESSGRIGRANLNGSNFGTLARLQTPALGIAIDAAGNKFYWSDFAGNIRRSNLNGRRIQNVVLGLTFPIDLAVGNLGTRSAAAPGNSSLPAIPDTTGLLANYPNPFNPETWIPYQLATHTDVLILIYDARGILVRRLELGHQPAGTYTSKSRAAYWDGRNTLGERVASGVYFYVLTAGDFSATRKMLILK